jgi:hypothetical protein
MLDTQDLSMTGKESISGVGCSIVERGGVQHLFATAAPRHGDTFPQQTEDALHAIEVLGAEAGVRGSIITQSVFLRNPDDLPACRQLMRDFYGRHLPATTYILQPPCSGKLLEVEVCAVAGGPGEVCIDRRGERLVIVHFDGMSWAHLADVRPQTNAAAVYDRSLSAFSFAEAALSAGGIRFDQVIRTCFTWAILSGRRQTRSGIAS